MKTKLLAISLLFVILATSLRLNITTTAQTYQMPYKVFQTQHYIYGSMYNTSGIIRYLSLPPGSMPMGIVYDNTTKKVWVALYMNESLASIDVLTKTVTIYPLPHQIDDFIGPMPWTLTTTPDNYVWFTFSYKNGPQQLPPQLPAFGTLDSSKNLVYIYYIQRLSGFGVGKDVKYHSNYIWVRTMSGLLKVSYTNLTSVVIEKAFIRDGGLGEGQMKFDGNNLWVTCTTSAGLVTRFNTVTETFDLNLTGFNRPLGIETDYKNVYVAECKWYNPDEPEPQWGTVAIINKATLQVTRVNVAKIIYDGPYSVLKDSFGYLWFTDNSGHIGIVGGIVYGNEMPNCYVPPYCYFMVEVPVGSRQIWFSAVGSAHIGVKDTGTLGRTDINLDGKVDMKDVGTVARYFGKLVPPAPSECDINSDGKVDMRDIGAVARNFGKML
jgi:DNA-binding beta-propeller fold protein YncE